METKHNDFTCTMCGKTDNLDKWCEGRTREIMEQKHLCFSCALWEEHIELDREERKDKFAVIDGHHFVLEPSAADPRFAGSCSATFKIRFNDGREVVCKNLWHQGRVPERFRDRLPDNAAFVKEEGFHWYSFND